jgi:hypothetical protein
MIGMVKVTKVFFFIARAAEPETRLGGFVGYFGPPLYGCSRRATGRGKYGLAWPSIGYRAFAIGGIVYGSSGGNLKYPRTKLVAKCAIANFTCYPGAACIIVLGKVGFSKNL